MWTCTWNDAAAHGLSGKQASDVYNIKSSSTECVNWHSPLAVYSLHTTEMEFTSAQWTEESNNMTKKYDTTQSIQIEKPSRWTDI